jgi:biotin operon repressor
MSDSSEPTIFVEDETLRQGFTIIPNAILRRPDLSPGAKLTYMMLLSYAWQQGSCFPGQERLAEDMGVTKRSVITYLQHLQESGFLIIKRRGQGLTNVYHLPRSENISPQARSENIALQTRSENIASQEVKKSAPQKVKNLHTEKNSRKSVASHGNKKTQERYDEHEHAQRILESAERHQFNPDLFNTAPENES